jgi:hypothetical protein
VVDDVENRRVLAILLSFALVLLASATGVQAHIRSGSDNLSANRPSPIETNRLSQQRGKTRLRKNTKTQPPTSPATPNAQTGEVVGNRITLIDGYSFEVDEVWKDGAEIWYRQGKISRGLPQVSVKSIKPILRAVEQRSDTTAQVTTVKNPMPAAVEKKPTNWIHLVDGARFRVDEVQETAGGYWYSRANLSIFLERDRVARIEIDRGESAAPAWRGSDWTSGNPMIDELIRTNGSRFGVDPYLVFLVIEQESHFRSRAVSPKGARGLMQLMPATARRLGVKNSFDVAENIKAGTQYLRELMDMFGGQVNLVLASYNAGEGAVLKYGRNVPPYRETRDYVKKIGKRYGLASREAAESETPVPRR